ncbi:ferritin [Clostridium sp.]|uniref:ferritin n=1 Tax=Clostridium sp. TaxID=1506 RepID=UPI002FC68136
MISERLFNELNKQMNYEFYSSHVYLALAGYCASQDLDGFTNFFTVQAEEEKFHAVKFFNFIKEMDGRITFEGIQEPRNEYDSILEAFYVTLEHEKSVTDRIYNLMDIATEEREHATISFLKWFIDEQVEEMSTVSAIIKKLQRIENDPHALYSLDAELATRTFVPPVAP